MEVTLDKIREELATCAERYGMEYPPEAYEQNAAVIRDAMAQMGLDPSDLVIQDAFLLGTFLCLGHLVNSQIVIGPAIPMTFIQAQVIRKWRDGELPVLSLADIMELGALNALNPQKCPFVGDWPDGRGSGACTKWDHHIGTHEVPILEVGKNGEIVARMLEFESE